MILLAGPKHLTAIINGNATATIRRGVRLIEIGETIVFKSNVEGDKREVIKTCTRVAVTQAKAFTSEDMLAAGLYEQLEPSWEVLNEVYPEAKQRDIFTVIYFE